MARFARIDSQIRANRLILANHFRVPELNPFFCESRFRGAKIANRRFEAIRANHSHVMKTGGFLRIDLRESIHTNFIDLLMGLFRGAVFRHGGGALKQPIKQPTETPTSTLALMGRFPLLMGRFPTLMGRFTDFVLRGRFTS